MSAWSIAFDHGGGGTAGGAQFDVCATCGNTQMETFIENGTPVNDLAMGWCVGETAADQIRVLYKRENFSTGK